MRHIVAAQPEHGPGTLGRQLARGGVAFKPGHEASHNGRQPSACFQRLC